MTVALLQAGAAVAATDRAETGLLRLRERLAADQASRLHVFPNDIATAEGRQHLLSALERRLGCIDVLINNAGIGLRAIREDYPTRPIRYWEVDGRTLEQFLAIHTVAPYLLANALLSGMLQRRWGRVVNVTTSLATMIRPGMSPYGGAKAATEAFTAMLASDLAGSGVTANILVPGGPVDTPILPDGIRGERKQWMQPAVMSAPIVWLCSSAADQVNGKRVVAAECDPHSGEPAELPGIAWPGFESKVHWTR